MLAYKVDNSFASTQESIQLFTRSIGWLSRSVTAFSRQYLTQKRRLLSLLGSKNVGEADTVTADSGTTAFSVHVASSCWSPLGSEPVWYKAACTVSISGDTQSNSLFCHSRLSQVSVPHGIIHFRHFDKIWRLFILLLAELHCYPSMSLCFISFSMLPFLMLLKDLFFQFRSLKNLLIIHVLSGCRGLRMQGYVMRFNSQCRCCQTFC